MKGLTKEKRSSYQKLIKKLTDRERYALDAYYINKGDAFAKKLSFEMAVSYDESYSWGESTFTRKRASFFDRPEVRAYLDIKEDDERIAKQASISNTLEDMETQGFDAIINELQRDRIDAKNNGDMDNYLKLTQSLLGYMKSSKEDIGEEERVHYYVPIVCTDSCPLYAEARAKLKDTEELAPPQERQLIE